MKMELRHAVLRVDMGIQGILTYLIFSHFNPFITCQNLGPSTKEHDTLSAGVSNQPIIDETSKLTEKSSYTATSTVGQSETAREIYLFFSNDFAFGAIIASIIFLHAFILFVMGQPIISKSGKIKLWEGNINGPENSQQISDWYTFSHVLHGVIFYGMAAGIVALFPLADIGVKAFFIGALLVEGLWEVIENSPWVIERYRATALANGYNGDSILNSICDTVAMSIGFWLAYVLPPWLTVTLAVAEELILAFLIRDNLTLNVIQLIHPFEAISKWQTAGNSNSNSAAEQQNLNEAKE